MPASAVPPVRRCGVRKMDIQNTNLPINAPLTEVVEYHGTPLNNTSYFVLQYEIQPKHLVGDPRAGSY